MDIVLLGSGNVASHLGRAFKMAGQNIMQVWSPDIAHATELATEVGSEPISDMEDISHSADLYIISVKDDAIPLIAEKLRLQDRLCVHTSGSAGLEVLQKISSRVGVFYPLQTFSKSKAVDFRAIPIVIEANSPEDALIIRAAADRLSERVIELSSEQRNSLHIAAVFACNFTNHLFAIAKQLLEASNMDFELIRPLIAETVDKVRLNDPAEVQTGPAFRNDISTLNAHMEMLRSEPKLMELYNLLSQSIVNFHKQVNA